MSGNLKKNKLTADYKSLIDTTPLEVQFKDIVEFDRLAERISAINTLFINIIEVGEGYIEFSPFNEPPLIEEIVSWIWTIRPDLSSVIVKHTLSDKLRLLIDSYQTGEMKKWWVYMSGK